MSEHTASCVENLWTEKINNASKIQQSSASELYNN